MNPPVAATVALIQRLHAGQIDWTGQLYWTHPYAVMGLLPEDADDDMRHAALLHDVPEDTKTSVDDLLAMGYTAGVGGILRLVSRLGAYAEMSYLDWIAHIVASGNRGAMWIKYADNLHNSDPARITRIIDPKRRARIERKAANEYAPSKALLRAGLGIAA